MIGDGATPVGNIVQILLGLAKSYFNIKGKSNTNIQVRATYSTNFTFKWYNFGWQIKLYDVAKYHPLHKMSIMKFSGLILFTMKCHTFSQIDIYIDVYILTILCNLIWSDIILNIQFRVYEDYPSQVDSWYIIYFIFTRRLLMKL